MLRLCDARNSFKTHVALGITEIILVRSYLLNDEQREAVKNYVSARKRPRVMPGNILQIRMRVKAIDFDQMQEDIKLLKKLGAIKVPIGRKAGDVKAKLTVRQPNSCWGCNGVNLRVDEGGRVVCLDCGKDWYDEKASFQILSSVTLEKEGEIK